MSWGGGSGKTARAVAQAFFDGKPRKRGNVHTDGTTYFLFNNAIARRVSDNEVPDVVARVLLGENPVRRQRFEVSWAGWPTATTERHLDALGVPGAWKGSDSQRNPRPPEICGKPVDAHAWYTLADAAARPAWTEPPKRRRAEPFVNLTMPLFA